MIQTRENHMNSITDGPIVAGGKYQLKCGIDGRGERVVHLESLDIYPFEVAPDRYVSGPKVGEVVEGNWGAGFSTPLGWVGVSCCLKSEADAVRSAEAWRKSDGVGRVRGGIRRWRERDGRIRLVAEGRREIPLSDSDRTILWDYLESFPWPAPEPEPEARQLSPELQRILDRAETGAMLDAERTPLAGPRPERNPGGRCPECGYSNGHRMDCCFV